MAHLPSILATILFVASIVLVCPVFFNRARRAVLWRPRRFKRPGIHLAEGCVVMGIAFLYLALSILESAWGKTDDAPPVLNMAALFFIALTTLAWAAPAVAVLLRESASLSNTFGIRWQTAWRDTRAGVRYGVMMIFPVAATAWLTQVFFNVFGRPVEQQDALVLLANTEAPVLLRAAFAVFCATLVSVCEEAAFRGVLLPALNRWRGAEISALAWLFKIPLARWHTALFLQAALFTLVHFNAVAAPALFCVGIFFGLGYARTGSLLTPVAMHAVFNVQAVLWACA